MFCYSKNLEMEGKEKEILKILKLRKDTGKLLVKGSHQYFLRMHIQQKNIIFKEFYLK